VLAWHEARAQGRSGDLSRAAEELGRRVWEPLRRDLGDARTVLIGPDGSLTAFPFAALPGQRPGTYLIEDLAMGYVDSGRDALKLRKPLESRGPAPGRGGGGFLAVGDVDFRLAPNPAAAPGLPGMPRNPMLAPGGNPRIGNRARIPGVGPMGPGARAGVGGAFGRPVPVDPRAVLPLAPSSRPSFAPLPGTRFEIERARDLFRGAFAEQYDLVMMGGVPTEATIKWELNQPFHWSVVHLATHGRPRRRRRLSAGRPGTSGRRLPFRCPASTSKISRAGANISRALGV
jgi:hypothetical protein